MQKTYSIKGMHCQSCVRKIEQGMAVAAEAVKVDLAKARIYLNAPREEFEALKARLASIGSYELLPEQTEAAKPFTLRPYFPLLLILAYLALVSCAGAADMTQWMRHFMAGFFLVFSFFKLLNLRAFASGYAKYDLLAMRWKTYGFVYPFCELALGLAYLFDWQRQAVLYATIGLTIFGACGVVASMRRKDEIRCACLGDLLNVPLSTVTLVEDLGMAAMAFLMLGA